MSEYVYGDSVTFTSQISAYDEWGGNTGTFIPAYSTGYVVYYKNKSTKDIADDLLEVKIATSPNKDWIEKKVWVRAKDFPQVHDNYRQ